MHTVHYSFAILASIWPRSEKLEEIIVGVGSLWMAKARTLWISFLRRAVLYCTF